MRSIAVETIAAMLLLATAAVAAETAATSAAPGVDWTVVALALVGATSLGTRILVWCRENAKLLRVIADVLERVSADPTTRTVGRIIKGEIEREIDKAGAGVADAAEKVAAKAEKRSGTNGGATSRRRESKLARLARGAKKWLPILGLLG